MDLQKLERALFKHDENCPIGKEFGRSQIELFLDTAAEAIAQGGEVRIVLLEGGGHNLEVIYRKPIIQPNSLMLPKD